MQRALLADQDEGVAQAIRENEVAVGTGIDGERTANGLDKDLAFVARRARAETVEPLLEPPNVICSPPIVCPSISDIPEGMMTVSPVVGTVPDVQLVESNHRPTVPAIRV